MRALGAGATVEAVKVTPDFPHALRIEVVEKAPVAVLVYGSERVAVAAAACSSRPWRPIPRGLPSIDAGRCCRPAARLARPGAGEWPRRRRLGRPCARAFSGSASCPARGWWRTSARPRGDPRRRDATWPPSGPPPPRSWPMARAAAPPTSTCGCPIGPWPAASTSSPPPTSAGTPRRRPGATAPPRRAGRTVSGHRAPPGHGQRPAPRPRPPAPAPPAAATSAGGRQPAPRDRAGTAGAGPRPGADRARGRDAPAWPALRNPQPGGRESANPRPVSRGFRRARNRAAR